MVCRERVAVTELQWEEDVASVYDVRYTAIEQSGRRVRKGGRIRVSRFTSDESAAVL
jgi:hypothetical protein